MKKLNQGDPDAFGGFESTAENARSGAGAPAYASCRKEPIFNFFTAPLSGEARAVRPWGGF